MTTIINTPGGSNDSSGVGLIMGLILAVVVIGLFVYFGLPMIRGTQPQEQPVNKIEITVPSETANMPSGN